jgi:hypothetical protein
MVRSVETQCNVGSIPTMTVYCHKFFTLTASPKRVRWDSKGTRRMPESEVEARNRHVQL